MTKKLRLRTISIDPAYGGGAEMLTPFVDSSPKGSAPLPPRNESIMENVVWVNQDGTQEAWLCCDGTLKGILKNNITLESLWGHAMASNKDNQKYWPHKPWKRQNRMEK